MVSVGLVVGGVVVLRLRLGVLPVAAAGHRRLPVVLDVPCLPISTSRPVASVSSFLRRVPCQAL